jgi:hypothetical protein
MWKSADLTRDHIANSFVLLFWNSPTGECGMRDSPQFFVQFVGCSELRARRIVR